MTLGFEIPPLPDHNWHEICRFGQSNPVAYVCGGCGERRPRGRAVVRHGELDPERRDQLEQAGFEVIESTVAPPGQIMVLDSRVCPGDAEETLWCTGTVTR